MLETNSWYKYDCIKSLNTNYVKQINFFFKNVLVFCPLMPKWKESRRNEHNKSVFKPYACSVIFSSLVFQLCSCHVLAAEDFNLINSKFHYLPLCAFDFKRVGK